MNIVIETFHSPYTGERVGGAETSLKLLAEEFAKKEHKVIFVSRSYLKTWFGFEKKKVNNVDVLIFTKFKTNILNTYKGKKIIARIRNFYIDKKLKDINVVHTYNHIDIIKKYAKLKPKHNYKLVVRMAGLKLFEDFERRPELIPSYEKYFNSIDLYNFISQGLLDLVNKKTKEFNLKIDFKPNFIQDIGIDLSQLPIKTEQYKNRNKTFKIVMASRLSSYQKRQDVLIKAMNYLKDDNIKLFIIGEGPNLLNLKKLAADEYVAEKVNFMPFKQGIWNTLIEYDLMVHACNYEGLSKIIIESMGVGLPVLASNVLPLNTYIKDGSNGFLVDNDPKEWADKIRSIVLHSDLLEEVAQSSKDFIQKSYSSHYNIDIYINHFANILEEENGSL